MSKPFSLSKNERLKSKKQIDALFLTGEAFFIFPYKVKYTFQKENPAELKFGISVPKRNFKKAVDRNRLKRLSRESYRLQKPDLKNDLLAKNLSLHVMFLYSHNEMLDYAETEKSMIKCVVKLRQLTNAFNTRA